MLLAARRYLHSDITVLRWLAVLAYFGLIGVWLTIALINLEPLGSLSLVGGFLGTQAAFILSAGTRLLCRPITLKRLTIPVLMTATLLTLLALSAGMAILEAADTASDWGQRMGVMLISSAAMLWGAVVSLLLYFTAGRERRSASWRLCAALVIAGIIELAIGWTCLAIAQDRGFLSGLISAWAIILGIFLLIWTLGPCVVFLFLRPRYRREKKDWSTRCQTCGYDLRVQLAAGGSADRCPECGTLIAR